MNSNKDIIVSIGGSVIFPDTGINIQFLKELNILVREKIALGKRFFIFAGGGHIMQEYQYTAERIAGKVKNEDLNWLGIHATRLNAHFLRTIFYDIASPNVFVRYDRLLPVGNYKVIICAGWLPGTTTDFDMVNLAKLIDVKKAYSLLNVSGVYDKDPKLFKNAKLIEKMKWADYREMTGDWWDPKRQAPFDPFASKLAEDFNMEVFFLDGKNVANFKNALEGKSFHGTVLS